MSVEEKIRLETSGQYISIYDSDSCLSVYVLYKENQFSDNIKFQKMNEKVITIINKLLDDEVKEFSEPQKISPYFIKHEIREKLQEENIIYKKVYVSR